MRRADVGPRCAGATGAIDEVADQVVGDLAEGLRGEDGIFELFERLVVTGLDCVDQVVETNGVGDLPIWSHASTVG